MTDNEQFMRRELDQRQEINSRAVDLYFGCRAYFESLERAVDELHELCDRQRWIIEYLIAQREDHHVTPVNTPTVKED